MAVCKFIITFELTDCFAGKLVLKIPWKNLYTEAVIAEIDGIYALAVPNVGECSFMMEFSSTLYRSMIIP
jgi:vacuolar protein sorting-associated protein 13A/C